MCMCMCVYVCCVGAECAPSTTYGGHTEFREMGESLCHCWIARCGLCEDSLDGAWLNRNNESAACAPSTGTLREREPTSQGVTGVQRRSVTLSLSSPRLTMCGNLER